MNICIPVDEDKGELSPVCAHFGSAPIFMMVDVDTMDTTAVPNANAHHAHGMCQPLASLYGHQVDAIVVSQIGMGALTRLEAARIAVYLCEFPTVKETVDAFKAGTLGRANRANACGHHGGGKGRGAGCGHQRRGGA